MSLYAIFLFRYSGTQPDRGIRTREHSIQFQPINFIKEFKSHEQARHRTSLVRPAHKLPFTPKYITYISSAFDILQAELRIGLDSNNEPK